MKRELGKIIEESLRETAEKEKWPVFDLPEIKIDRTRDERFGDYTTNVAMALAGILKKPPMKIAEEIVSDISGKIDGIDKIEAVKPGHINFYISDERLHGLVAEIVEKGNGFGANEIGLGSRALIEFISSNPTGPIHLGNARGGPIGDALANVLEKSGFSVEREFYVNDFGNQVKILGHSVLGNDDAQYKGEYVAELAKRLPEKLKNQSDPLAVGVWAAGQILEGYIKPTAEKAHIRFDRWFSEKSLHDSGKVSEAIGLLKEKGLTYEKDGALWFQTTEFGDDKDRVLVKENGDTTYIAADCAYHMDKVSRGYDKMINIQGADHHKEAEVIRKFVSEVLGEGVELETILTQFVRILKDGKEVKMSKRKGVYFAFDDLLDEVGVDAVRFISLSYAVNSHVNFDIDLATERSEKNPIYYVQYAHARICSILMKAGERSVEKVTQAELTPLAHPKEMGLARELSKFPEIVEDVARSYETHKLPHYAVGLADKLHSFYAACRVIDESDPKTTRARLVLVRSAKIVLAETLRLIGVSAPEKM